MTDMEKTLVLTLGGTIESFYAPHPTAIGESDGTPEHVPMAPHAHNSVIPAALDKLGYGGQFVHVPVAMRDSKANSTAELDHALMCIAQSDATRVIVVQGTDTMPVHARYMQRRLLEWGAEQGMDQKTIIFTGAMGPLRDADKAWRNPQEVPYKNDGWHNLSAAMIDAKREAPGVYIRMEKGPHPWHANEVSKYVHLGEPNASGVREVIDSGFVQDAPEKHQDIVF